MKQINAILIGAGLRGREAYASYALSYPAELNIVAVAEKDKEKREFFAKLHKIPKENQFEDDKELLQMEKMADCALVCTQDNQHYEPVMQALAKGYHVLCEKPMSKVEKEIYNMAETAKQFGKILSICHVLRFSPFYVKIKELLDAGKIGTLESIHQVENVGYWHYAHSFVRGAWRNSEESSPMILAKSCHDMDILLWLSGSKCKTIQSFGNLSYFKEKNAPSNAPKYCMSGCVHKEECPYYAPKFYLTHPKAIEDCLIQAVSLDTSPQAVMEQLKDGPYGRCVFHCDNDVVDHQVVNMEFENEVTASFTMSAFTYDCRREISLMGSKGQIKGDMEEGKIEVFDFVTGNTEHIVLNVPAKGHSGSDERLMRDFIMLVMQEGTKKGRTSAEDSVDSHLMALAAEKSRMEGRTINFGEYKKEI